jgi:hypothetical protein
MVLKNYLSKTKKAPLDEGLQRPFRRAFRFESAKVAIYYEPAV